MVLALALALAGASAQTPAPVPAANEPGSDLTVYLVTMDPGNQVWERFGHNAIWIHDGNSATDSAYNWGIFDMHAAGFIPNFLRGLMTYEMRGEEMSRLAYVYEYYNRSVHVQELRLTPSQRLALQEFVRWNELPENTKYQYHYFRDNCSTRVRDALDRALGGQLRKALEPKPSGSTYRSQTRRLTYGDVPVYTGLMIAMGPNIDAPLSLWNEAFIPMELQSSVRGVSVQTPNGVQPLVANERVLFQAAREPLAAAAPARLPHYLIAGLVLAALLAVLGSLPNRWARAAFITVAGIFSLVTGLVGTIMMLLWALTDHDVTYRNENLLQSNVLSLVLLGALVGLALKRAWGPKIAMRFALVVAGLSVLGFAIQILPGLDQVNGESIALLLPAHIALAWILVGRHTTASADQSIRT